MRKSTSRLVSLNALRTFEAAGRLESFTAAATELSISQTAISRQISRLEVSIGRQLFLRVHRGVVLTAAGRTFAQRLSLAFAEIEQAVIAARHERLHVLRVSVEPAFAACWLLPRVETFLQQYKDVDLRIDSSIVLRSIGLDFDLAVRYLTIRSKRPAKHMHHLMDVIGFPVAAPSLIGKHGLMTAPTQLTNLPLLHEDDGAYWSQWFAAAGVTDVKSRKQLQMDDQAALLRAAVKGQGVAIANSLVAADELAAGQLVRLFSVEVLYGAYWLVHTPNTRRNTAAMRFATWLRGTLPGHQRR